MHIESKNQSTKRRMETKNINLLLIKTILKGQFYKEGLKQWPNR